MVDDFFDKKIFLNENIVSTILKNNGLFCNHIPYCFSTTKLADKIYEVKALCESVSVNPIVFPLTFTMNKNSLVRRTIGIPNVFSYLRLLFHLETNWELYKRKSYSRNSESHINVLLPKFYNRNLKASLQTRHKKFVGYKVKVSLDISNCFDSIYTHSITWAILGKEKAKDIFGLRDRKKFSDEENKNYDISDQLDELMQNLNGKQTNGIITGPYASVIFSEIILSAIDNLLVNEGFQFTRYVDDYNFYFINDYDVQPSIEKIAKILKEYNFTLNISKIKKENYPFDLSIDFQRVYQPYLDNGQISDAIYKALEYYKTGEEGAITYLLKMLQDKTIKGNFNIELILDLLLNIVLNVPKVSAMGIELLENNMTDQFLAGYKKILNKLLHIQLENEHYHESMWLFYIMGKKAVGLDNENLSLLLKSRNDFLIIMALNYLNKNIKLVYSKTISPLSKKDIYNDLTESFNDISLMIKNDGLTGKHWLLAYEIAYHNYTLNGKIKTYNTKTTKIFRLFKEKDINFYNPF